MRKEPFFVGDNVHVFNRGNRKQEIVRDDNDKQNFLLGLYYLNNKNSPPQPIAKAKEFLLSKAQSRFNLDFEWPGDWGPRDALVDIIAFTLMNNHFHLVLREIREGGIAEFMRKISNSMTGYFNEKYQENGRLFQGSYKARRIDNDNYLQYMMVYMHIKNVFELYPGGIKNALHNFDDAFEFALKYPYSSLGGHFSDTHLSSTIVSVGDAMVAQTLGNKEGFKEFARNCIEFISFDEKTAGIGRQASL